MVTPADARQLHRMLAVISALRSGGASLVEAADSLLFLRDALERVDESWSDEFTSHVATLESAGSASDEQIATMGSTYQSVVLEALEQLEELVRRVAHEQLPNDDNL